MTKTKEMKIDISAVEESYKKGDITRGLFNKRS